MLAIPSDPSDLYLKQSILLANKIIAESQQFRGTIKTHFGGLDNLQKVLTNVLFDDSSPRSLKLPPDALAESWREIPLRNYTIFLNWRFKAQFEKNKVAIENKRLQFVLAVTILHEICHLCLRRIGKLNTPNKLKGLKGPEAGEFFEIHTFGGLITMRLSAQNKKKTSKCGLDPSNMGIEAVLLRSFGSKLVAIRDSEIERVWACVQSKHPFPADMFPLNTSEHARKVGQYALKRANGAHENLRSCEYLKEDRLAFEGSIVLDRGVNSPSKKFRH
jgi:hypothetical protein